MKEAKPRRVGFLIGTLFRSLINNGGFHWSARSVEEIAVIRISGNSPYNYHRIKAAWLESERKKAETVKWSRRSFVC